MSYITQKVIPSIFTMKDFEQFLQSEYEYCIILDFHINLLSGVMKELHAHQKKGIVHLDLVKGLASDEHGTEFLCQVIQADGVISTKAKAVEYAKKNKKIAIMRLFLIDTKSLAKGLHLVNSLQPDYIEVLPGIAYDIIPYIKANTQIPLIGGGLIKSVKQIDKCIDKGMCAVTIGSFKLCLEYAKEKATGSKI